MAAKNRGKSKNKKSNPFGGKQAAPFGSKSKSDNKKTPMKGRQKK